MGAGGRRAVARRRQASAYVIPAFDPANKSANITLSNSNRTAQKNITGNQTYCAGGTPSKNSGKLVFAVSMDMRTTHPSGLFVGVFTGTLLTTEYFAYVSTGWGLQCNVSGTVQTYNGGSSKSFTGNSTDYGPENGDLIYVAVDFEGGKIWFGVTDKGVNPFFGDPASGTGAQYTFTPRTTLSPAISLYDNGGIVTLVDVPDAAIPAGFSKWSA